MLFTDTDTRPIDIEIWCVYVCVHTSRVTYKPDKGRDMCDEYENAMITIHDRAGDEFKSICLYALCVPDMSHTI